MPVDLSDYVPVAERIAKLRADHPDAVYQTLRWFVREIAGRTYLFLNGALWLTPDDPRPSIVWVQEDFPGGTPYTRGSEIMNAETSAFGRAIVAHLAADTTRGIASRDEVEASRAREDDRRATQNQRFTLAREIEERGLPDGVPWPLPPDPDDLTFADASRYLDLVRAQPRETEPPTRVATLRADAPEYAGTPWPPGNGDPGSVRATNGETPAETPQDAADARPWERRPFPFGAPADAVGRHWRTILAAVPGIGPARLLTQAREIAVERGLDVPAALDEIADPELVNAVRLWMTARADERGTG